MRRLRRDEGVVMILVGLLLVVLLGLAGMAIDVGALYAERRQLRNGADAAALAIAEDCGLHAKPCDQATAEATAQLYADANSRDGASGVKVEFPLPGRVQVVTSAFDDQAGVPGVRVPLMSLLGLDRVTVTAAATAIFDPPISGVGLPLIIDRRDYSPDREPYEERDELKLYSFGLLKRDGRTECSTPTLKVGEWSPEETDPASWCSAQYLEDHVYEEDIVVPLYSAVDWNENEHRDEYRVAGFAAFHVTGYELASGALGRSCQPEPEDPHEPPPPWRPCLRGFFPADRPLVVYTGTDGGPDYGVVLVRLVS